MGAAQALEERGLSAQAGDRGAEYVLGSLSILK